MSAGADFAVDLAQLEDLVVRMQAFTDHLGAVRDAAGQHGAGLAQQWSGSAAAAQQAAARSWDTAMAQVQESLAELRCAAHVSHGNYRAAVDANRVMWRR